VQFISNNKDYVRLQYVLILIKDLCGGTYSNMNIYYLFLKKLYDKIDILYVVKS